MNSPEPSAADKGQAKSGAGMILQYSTFYVADYLYGIPVTRVQEIVKPMEMATVPLSENHVRGLINLRGQVTTAIGLRELFGIETPTPEAQMNVVCKAEGQLISLQVDRIGDVMDVEESWFEDNPQTIPERTKRYLSGVYKVKGKLLSILDIDKIMKFLNSGSAA